ncbi:ZFAT protein, partial [Polyodon spathula]|nr:ZFAT protein [Polyodon spathula]
MLHCQLWTGVPRGQRTIGRAPLGWEGLRSARVSLAHRTPATPVDWPRACGPAYAVSIFMCKACNLFSPSRTELLTHVSEQHTVESLCPDDIIVALRPLSTTGQSEKSGAECVLKRKRGRPKGSTKKYCVEEELVDASASQREEAKPEKEQEKKGPESGDPSGVLECRKCSRRFCNTRQLKKHICIMGLKEEVEEEDENDPGIKSASDGKYEDRGRPPKRSRIQSTEKASVSKDCEQPSGAKKPIISMVLTAHEAVPGMSLQQSTIAGNKTCLGIHCISKRYFCVDNVF